MVHSTRSAERSTNNAFRIGPVWALVGGPLLALAVFLVLPADLDWRARAVAGVAVLMASWWMTEAIPIPVTSLLPVVAFPLLDVAKIGDTTTPYAGSVVFLVLGGVLLGLAVQRWGLHLRIALLTVRLFGTSPSRLVLGLMVASAFISMWVSNTATAVIMVPIGVSILELIHSLDERPRTPRLTAAVLLGIAYGVTIGSMATLIGQPPMALMRGYLADTHGIEIGFAQWMLVGVPFAAVMLTMTWLVLTRLVFRAEVDHIPGGLDLIKRKLAELGPLSPEERRVLSVFAAAIVAWVVLPLVADLGAVARFALWLSNINDTSVAIGAALLMFVLPASGGRGRPLLEWSATKEVPWGVLLLFGGGLTLSNQFTETGLSQWIGQSVQGLTGLPVLVVLAAVTVIIVLLTELTSNTATSAAFFPIMGAIAVGLGIDPLLMTIVVTLAVSMAFMLPVATPSNAVAFASGELRIQQMIRAGIWLNILGFVLTMVAVLTLVPWVFGVGL